MNEWLHRNHIRVVERLPKMDPIVLVRLIVALYHRLTYRDLYINSKGPFTLAMFDAQFNAIFIALKVQFQNRAYKPAATSVRF